MRIRDLSIPLAIVIAGAMIALGLFYLSKSRNAEVNTTAAQALSDFSKVRDVSPDDHVLGNPNAEIKIIEYSDPECPYCKDFQTTMHKIIDTYGASGKVAWIYRHFPITDLHPKSQKEAEALECAQDLGGKDMFWKYADKIYATTPSNNQLDIGAYNTEPQNGKDAGQLSVIATSLGLNKDTFEACLSNDTYKARVARDTKEARAAGGRGTPYTILLVDGEQVPLSGAQPFAVIKGLIDTILATPKQ